MKNKLKRGIIFEVVKCDDIMTTGEYEQKTTCFARRNIAHAQKLLYNNLVCENSIGIFMKFY